MDSAKSLNVNLDEFKKITIKLTNIGDEISDENKIIVILNSLPDSYIEVKTIIKYDR